MKEIYLLSCAEVAEGGGVYKYGLTETGKLKEIAYLPCPKPMYAVIFGERLHILLRSPFNADDHSGFGRCACHLAAEGNDVYIVNYLSGNIVKNCKKVVDHSGAGVNLPRQDMPHTHFTTFLPDKKYVLCCDLGLDTIFIYDRDLNEISRAKVPQGYGVRHLVFSKDGEFFYAVNELVPSVSIFKYSDGAAKYIDTTKFDCKDVNSTAAAIRLDGNRLYASVRGENEIFVFDVCGATLRPIADFSCGGSGPRDFDIVCDYIVCTNEHSDTVTVIDKTSHSIMDELPMRAPLNVVKGEYNGF